MASNAQYDAVEMHDAARPAVRSLLAWLVVVLALWIGIFLNLRTMSFQEPHAWVSAHFSTMARSFAEHGLHDFVPVQNNEPRGSSPDYYTHWPPLFPAVLSRVFLIAGDTPATTRTVMLLVLLLNAAAVGLLAGALGGRMAGLSAAFVLLTTPVVWQYGLIGLPLYPALLCGMLSLLCAVHATRDDRIHRGWATAACILLAIGVWCSWEPVLLAPGMFVAAWWTNRRHALRFAIIYGVAGAAAVAAALGIYLLQVPDLAQDLWHTVLLRMGLREYEGSAIDIHLIVNREEYQRYVDPSLVELIRTWLGRAWREIGVVAIAALTAMLFVLQRRDNASRPSSAVFVLGSLLSMWALWFIVLSNHAYVHEFQIVLLAPAGAVAAGLMYQRLVHRLARSGRLSRAVRVSASIVLLGALPALLAAPLVGRYVRTRPPHELRPLAAMGLQIAEHTPPGAVVLSSSANMIGVYHSERHVIRDVNRDAIVAEVLPRLGPEFPDNPPVYLAIEPARRDAFTRTLAEYPVVHESDAVVLVRLSDEQPPRP